jgi:D-aminopeptidase
MEAPIVLTSTLAVPQAAEATIDWELAKKENENVRSYLREDSGDRTADGSIMIIIATGASLSDRNLKRRAKRGMTGLAWTGASISNGSGDYVIAFSTAEGVRRTPQRRSNVWAYPEVPNDQMSPLFQAAIEATEEAIYNSLCMAKTMTGYAGRTIHVVPLDEVQILCNLL